MSGPEPSPAALRAAEKIHPKPEPSAVSGRRSTTRLREWRARVRLTAQTIDRETGHAELVAALRELLRTYRMAAPDVKSRAEGKAVFLLEKYGK